jgi:hypothetical protein
MINKRYTKIAIFLVAATLLSIAALVVGPARMAYAQGNMTMSNANATGANVTGLTVVMDVDTFKNLVKKNHPLLAQLQENEDRDLIAKIKLQDAKQALKNEIALNILHLLAQYKAIDEAP